MDRTLAERRPKLEAFAADNFARGGLIRLSPATSRLAVVLPTPDGPSMATMSGSDDVALIGGDQPRRAVRAVRAAGLRAAGLSDEERRGAAFFDVVLFAFDDEAGFLREEGVTGARRG